MTCNFNKFCCQTELLVKEPSNSVCTEHDLVFLQVGLSPQVDAGKLIYRSKTRGEELAEEMEVRLPAPSISCSTPNLGKGVPGENPHGYKENMYIPHGKTELEVNPEPFCSDATIKIVYKCFKISQSSIQQCGKDLPFNTDPQAGPG